MTPFKTLAVAMAMIGTMAIPSQAADITPDGIVSSGWYLRADAGWSWLSWDRRDDDEIVLGGGIGYRYNENLRAEFRVDWAGLYDTRRSADDVNITTALINGYYDFAISETLTPYVGAGAGYGVVDTFGFDGSGFAYALMMGADVKLMDKVSLDLGYRLRGIVSSKDDTMEHQFLSGLRFEF
jgi:opacity protein-like surface antigen